MGSLAELLTVLTTLWGKVLPIVLWFAANSDNLVTWIGLLAGYFHLVVPIRNFLRLNKLIVAADWSYGQVDRLARKTPNKIDDKVAEGLLFLRDFFKKLDGALPSPQDEAIAKAIWTERHEQETKNGLPPSSPV